MTGTLDALGIRRRLGRDTWRAPQEFGPDGWMFNHADGNGRIIVTASDFPEMPGVDIIHASVSFTDRIPGYADLTALHRAVWPDGHALQCFVPPSEHINIHDHTLHLWGRADGQRLWPINFGEHGTI